MTPQQVLAVIMAHATSGHPEPPEEFWEKLEATPVDKLASDQLAVIQQAGLIHLLQDAIENTAGE